MKRITILLLSLLLCGALCAQQTTEAVEGTANNEAPAEQTIEQTLQAPTTAEELWASAGAAYSAEDYASAIASYSWRIFSVERRIRCSSGVSKSSEKQA